MNLKLIRLTPSYDGVYGELFQEDNSLVGVTLEHAYPTKEAASYVSYNPKLQDGVYTCVRGQHKLHDAIPFETFEITGVKGHSGILFHVGNYNKDSEGCVLLGRRILHNPDAEGRMISSSRNTFNKFMDIQKGINEFTLTVTTKV